MPGREVTPRRWDPAEPAYAAGYALARSILQAEHVEVSQVHKTRRQVHVVSDTEYIITEETTFIETSTFNR